MCRVRSIAIAVSGLLCITGQPALAVSPASQQQLAPAAPRPMATAITAKSVSPSTISFTLADPDAAAVTGAGSVTWTTTGGGPAGAWTVGVSSTNSSFTNCSEIPLSAVTAKCTSVTGGTAGACNASSLGLTGTAQQIASGKESPGTANYTVNVTFSITDAWKYKGHTSPLCTLSVTYTLTAN